MATIDQPPFLSSWDQLQLPEQGNRFDSRFGGPTPWQSAIKDWAALGQDAGQRPFEGLGKFDITKTLPLAPNTTPLQATGQLPTPAPPPQPGLFESLGKGLPTMFTQFLGNGDLTKVAGGIGGFVGSLVDMPFKAIPSIGFLPGGADVADTFKLLPETAEKKQYESFIASDKGNALRYMGEYLDQHGTEVARHFGISGAFSPMFTPSQDFSEQMRRLIFGGLSAAGQGVARTYVGSSLRNVDGTIINADQSTLPPELQALVKRYKAGDLNHDELLDEMTNGAFRWTNDDSLWGRGISMFLDIATDPVTWASLGLGGAAKAVETGAVRSGSIEVAAAVRRAGLADRVMDDAARAAGASSREAWAKAVETDGVQRTLADWAKTNRPDLYREGMDRLSGAQRAEIAVEPILRPAAKVADSINNMFDMFGVGAVGRAMSTKVLSARMKGFGRYYGATRLKSLQDFMGPGRFQDFARYLGIAGENQHLSLEQMNIAREAMGTDPAWRGTALSPQEKAMTRMGIDEHFTVEGERHAARTSETFLPQGAGKTLVTETRAKAVQLLARDLAHLSGKTVQEATDFLSKQDTKGLQAAHQLVYGYTVSIHNNAKRTAIKQLQEAIVQAQQAGDTALVTDLTEKLQAAERYTLVSERNLTFQRAQNLRAAIDADTDAARKAARDAVEQYDTLGHTYGQGKLNSEDLRTAMKDHLDELLKDPENKLIRTVSSGSLHPDVARAMAGSKYEVGLAPTDRWGITRAADGRVRGVNTFIDHMDDAMPSELSRPFGVRDIWKERLLGQVHGARLYYEAKAKFREYGQTSYGLTRHDSESLFAGIHKEAMKQGIGVRGLSPDDILRVAEDVEVTPAMRARVGPGSLMELTLRAFEGDLATVGFAPKASGMIKTAGGRLGNYMGIISERYYPHLRFGANPIFVMMESVEGPFFMLLRGIKPGVRWTKDMLRMNSILEYMQPGLERYADQLERAQSATIDMDMAMRLSRAVEGDQIQGVRRLIHPMTWHRTNPLEAGLRASGIWDDKRLQYVKHTGRAASEQWDRWMSQNQPELHAIWQQEMGTATKQELFMRFMEERGGYTQSNRWMVHLMDAVKPSNLGKESHIRVGDVARFHGFPTTQELYDNVRSGALGHDAFMKRYTDLNVPPAFAERAWSIADGFTADQWKNAFDDVFPGDKVASTTYWNWHHWMANARGMSFEELMAREYGDLPRLVARPRDVPTAAFRQSLEKNVEDAGAHYYKAGHPKFDAVQARSRELIALSPDAVRRLSSGKVDANGVLHLDSSGPFAGTDLIPPEHGPNWEDYSQNVWAKPEMAGGIDGIDTGNPPKGTVDRRYVKYDAQGEPMAILTFSSKNGKVTPGSLSAVTRPDARRQGNMTALYDHATAEGYDLRSASGVFTTAEGKAFSEAWKGPVPIKPTKKVAAVQKAQDRVFVRKDPKVLPPKPMPAATDPAFAKHANDVLADTLNAHDNIIEHALNSANWYDTVTSLSMALSEKMPEAMVRGLLEAWEKKAGPAVKDQFGEAFGLLHTGDLELARQELAARMVVGFAGTQQNTSVVDGIRFLARMMDETVNGRFQKYGLGVVTGRLHSLIENFGSLTEEQLGIKLADFADSLAGKTTRSMVEGMPVARMLKPGAIDIWMKRVAGYPDTAYVNYLTTTRMKALGQNPDDKALYAKAEKAIIEERGWTGKTIRSPHAPNAAEYEYVLGYINDIKDAWNAEHHLEAERVAKGMTPEWQARDVQALLWAAEQKKLGYPDQPIMAVLQQSGRQIAVEVNPFEGNRYFNKYPDYTEMRRVYGDEEALTRMTDITREINDSLAPIISEASGATYYRSMTREGRWSEPKRLVKNEDGTETLVPSSSSFTPNTTSIIWGSETQQQVAMVLEGILKDQYGVYSLTRPPEMAMRGTAKKPNVRSNVMDGRHWSLDLAMANDVPAQVSARYTHHLETYFADIAERQGYLDLFQGSMVGLLDDGSEAARHVWQQTRFPPGNIAPWEPSHMVAEVLDEDGNVIVSKATRPERMTFDDAAATAKEITDLTARIKAATSKEERNALKEVLAEKTADMRKAKAQAAGYRKEKAKTQAEFEQEVTIPPEDLAKLADGSWVKDYDASLDPMPVRVERNLVQVNMEVLADGREAQVARLAQLGVTDGAALLDRLTPTAEAVFDAAHAKYAYEALDGWNGHAAITGEPTDLATRLPDERKSGPDAYAQRGPTGTVRAGFLAGNAAHGASAYFVRNAVDATTAVHESFHLFARGLDQSARDEFVAAYNSATGRTGRRAKRAFDRDVEEWTSYEFEKFAAGDVDKSSTFYTTFKAYSDWAQATPGIARGSAAAPLFRRVLDRERDIPSAYHSIEGERAWEAARISLLRGEDEAFTTSYYKHERTFIERSLNHPYLGLYPISYMWGKVLPELTRFLVRRPFGLKAPLLGLSAAAHVWTNVQMQLQVDEELRSWVDKHPESIRLMQMMTPGTPWELPVNMPAVFRHFQETNAENELRAAQGQKPIGFDLGAGISDSVAYSIGYTNILNRAGQILPELLGTGRDAVSGLTGLDLGGDATPDTETASLLNSYVTPK